MSANIHYQSGVRMSIECYCIYKNNCNIGTEGFKLTEGTCIHASQIALSTRCLTIRNIIDRLTLTLPNIYRHIYVRI